MLCESFFQFQINTNMTVVVVTFITALAAQSEQSLGALRLLWINLIMDTFDALALATDPASEVLQAQQTI
jgi:Ca2+-transporting ATPase